MPPAVPPIPSIPYPTTPATYSTPSPLPPLLRLLQFILLDLRPPRSGPGALQHAPEPHVLPFADSAAPITNNNNSIHNKQQYWPTPACNPGWHIVLAQSISTIQPALVLPIDSPSLPPLCLRAWYTGSMPSSSNAAGRADTKRFQLPALDFKFGSLTEGTDIPPPLPSPVTEVPTPPKTPTEEGVEPKPKQETNGAANGAANGYADRADASPVPEPAEQPQPQPQQQQQPSTEENPSSPTLSNRGSLRRLLSRSLLVQPNEDQASVAPQASSRPPSRTASVVAEEKKSKRSSGWFRRLRSSDHGNTHAQPNTRHSMHIAEELNTKPAGPPPPMIPEMSKWKTKVDTKIGDDLFKGIR